MRKRRWDAKSKKLLLALKDNDGKGGGKENRLGRFFSARRRQEGKYALTRTLMYVCSGYDAHTVHVRTKGGNRERVWSGEREELRGRSQKSSIVVERSSFASKPEIEEEEERILPWWLLPSLPL